MSATVNLHNAKNPNSICARLGCFSGFPENLYLQQRQQQRPRWPILRFHDMLNDIKLSS